MITRRRWLRVGLIGGAALGAAGLIGHWRSRWPDVADDRAPAPLSHGWSASASVIIAALAPVMLGPACAGPTDCERVVDGVRAAVQALSPAAQRDLAELFTLLDIGPARGLLTGIWSDWPDVTPAQIEAFLERWRHSRLALLQAGYHALHDLILAAWYAEPAAWADIGYPGPPSLQGI